MDWTEFAKLVFGRVWFTSFIVLVFCLLAKWGGSVGMVLDMPSEVVPWINFALLLSASILIVQTGYSVMKGLRYLYVSVRAEREDWREARLNMAALFPMEAAILRELLGDRAPRRFTVWRDSPIQPLVNKGVVRIADSAGDSGMLCEVAPSIYARRAEIIPSLPTKQQVRDREKEMRERAQSGEFDLG